ncbi:MAG: FtsB family cell division protein [Acidimicrobiales bacterium]
MSKAGGRAIRRRATRTRRNRLVLIIALLASAAIVGAWFPVSSLLHQRQQLASASAALSRLDRQNARLAHEARQLRTPTALDRIAAGEYGLVPPGDQAYQVLPASGSDRSGGTLAPTGSLATRASGVSASAGHESASSGVSEPSGSTASEAPGSFFNRVLRTLEFWR